MFWLLAVALFILAVIVAAAVTGMVLPETARATVVVTVDRPPHDVYAAMMDYREHPIGAGSGSVQRIEPLPETPAGPAWREVLGSTTVEVRTLEATPHSRIVRELSDPRVPMTSRWDIRLQPEGQGTRVTVDQATTIRPGTWRAPFFRVIMRLAGRAGVRGYLKTLER